MFANEAQSLLAAQSKTGTEKRIRKVAGFDTKNKSHTMNRVGIETIVTNSEFIERRASRYPYAPFVPNCGPLFSMK
jgi:hypothetical protein